MGINAPASSKVLIRAAKSAVGSASRAEVVWRPLSRAGVAFLDACAKGHTLEVAATSALNVEPTADFAALISTLLDAGALIPTDSPTDSRTG